MEEKEDKKSKKGGSRYKRHADEVFVLNNLKFVRNILRKAILNSDKLNYWYQTDFEYMNKNIYKEDKLDLLGRRKRRKKAEILEL